MPPRLTDAEEKEYAPLAAGVAGMDEYTLYCLDGANKISAVGEIIRARNDGEVLELVRAQKLNVPCEICQGARLVARMTAQTSGGQSGPEGVHTTGPLRHPGAG